MGVGLVSAVALAASIGLASSAQAADLGGDCCADLEERVAELEATTARKGNRKVSLTVSGWVGEQVLWWDDGTESNAYVTGLGVTLSSHFKLTGQATIAPGYQAGYVIHVETNSNDPIALNQNTDDGGAGVSLLQSYWFINSDRLGKLSVGQLSQASDNAAILVDGSGSLVPANWVLFDNLSFIGRRNGANILNVNGGNITWGEAGFCHHTSLAIGGDCNGVPLNAVRYDSPTFAGFSVSASWGEDDFWDVAARYAGEFNGIKLAVTAAYSHQADESGVIQHRDSDYFQIGAFITHVPTGLFFYGAYGHENNNNSVMRAADGFAIGFAPDNNHWYMKAGLRRKWNQLGHTVLFGEYGKRDDMYSADLLDASTGFGFDGNRTADSELRQWGLGVAQEIDAAAMSMWLVYRNYDAEISGNGVTGVNIDFDEMHIVKFGALINF
ncbi:MAG: porin [Hyphomicrobiaceae bacterium]|nr:porin [Hyphomicrobiaceae bacterium]